MHFSTAALVLSGASVALAGSFAPPAAPAGHIAARQASREQVIRRQQHNMQKVKRQSQPSNRPVNECGAQSALALMFTGINARDIPEKSELDLINGQYVLADLDFQSLSASPALADASRFTVSTLNGVCQFTSTNTDIFLNVNGLDGGEYQQVFFSTAEQAASEEARVPGQLETARVPCRVGAGDILTCSYTNVDNEVLDQFIVCNDAPSGDKFVGLTSQSFFDATPIGGCTRTTLMAFGV